MIWVQVYQSKNKELATLVFENLKENFIGIHLSMSAIEGKPFKIKLEGDADERPLAEHAFKFEKEYLKQQKASTTLPVETADKKQ